MKTRKKGCPLTPNDIIRMIIVAPFMLISILSFVANNDNIEKSRLIALWAILLAMIMP